MALIKLPESVTFTGLTTHDNQSLNSIRFDSQLFKKNSDAISPICLAPATEPLHAGDPLHVSGWGKPSDGNNIQAY
jgi:hypothetical protein